MPKRKNMIRDLVGDAPALAPGLPSDRGGFDDAPPVLCAACAERQLVRQVSTDPGGATPASPASAGGASAPASPARAKGTLKERACQMTLYLEPETYDALREIAHRERTKMHPLLLQAVDQLLKERAAVPANRGGSQAEKSPQ
ncbi:hypothetical protein ACVMAJ_003544 [Bradyrhizobium sp. USDA 4448]